MKVLKAILFYITVFCILLTLMGADHMNTPLLLGMFILSFIGTYLCKRYLSVREFYILSGNKLINNLIKNDKKWKKNYKDL